MTRVAVIPTLTDGRAGLWSTARSEGRVPLNWAALLGVNGYDVVVVSQQPDFPECSVPGVSFLAPDDVGDVDWVLFGSTSVLGSNWYGRTTVRTRRVVRLQWPTGGNVDASGDVVAVPHGCLAGQVAAETEGRRTGPVHILPSPTLPLAWWERACGLPAAPMPERDCIIWAARDGFAGSDGPSGEEALSAWERSTSLRGMRPYVLSVEQHASQYVDRLRALGATFTRGLHLGEVLRAMRRAVIAVTLPAFMGPTLTEAIFEDCPPLVWSRYRALIPELCDAAEKHGVLLEDRRQIQGVMERLLLDWKMRAAYVDSCKFAFADNSPDRALAAWKRMETSCG